MGAERGAGTAAAGGWVGARGWAVGGRVGDWARAADWAKGGWDWVEEAQATAVVVGRGAARDSGAAGLEGEDWATVE